jgi:putative endonuclease
MPKGQDLSSRAQSSRAEARREQERDLQLRNERRYYVYIMANRSLNLYTGVTNSIYQRALQHKSGEVEGFTKKYNINRLVYYEVFEQIGNAIAREKQIKAWTRAKRLALIKSMNPAWQDLAEGWGQKAEMQIPRVARDDKPLNVRKDDKSIRRNDASDRRPEAPTFDNKNKIA